MYFYDKGFITDDKPPVLSIGTTLVKSSDPQPVDKYYKWKLIN